MFALILLPFSAQASATLADLSTGDLVITEVMANPSAVAHYRGEWLEITNRSGSAVDLDGLVVENAAGDSFTVSGTLMLSDGSATVLASRSNSAINGGNTAVGYQYSYADFQIRSTSESLTLSHDGTEFDGVDLIDGTDGVALSLDPDHSTAADNNDTKTWCAASSTYGDGDYGTPGSANDDCTAPLARGDLLLTEIMLLPTMSTWYQGVWVELYNASSETIDLYGIEFAGDDGDGFTVDESVEVGAGEYVILALRSGTWVNGGVEGVAYTFSTSDLRLSQSDGITVSYDGVDLDEVSWDSSFPMSEGYAMSLALGDMDTDANDSSDAWCDAQSVYGDGDYGTPGELNDDCTDDCTVSTFYADEDDDGYGDAGNSIDACVQPDGYTTDATDCDDADDTSSPAGVEVCDDADNDCDGDIDEDAADPSTWYADEDHDFYGDPSVTEVSCDRPSGYRSNGLDCNDSNSSAHPRGTEVCDGADNDCNGDTDEGFPTATFYADGDGDLYGDPDSTITTCDSPEGYTANSTDCDDSEPTANPGEVEVCDGIDNDCDGDVDDDDIDVVLTDNYPDDDGDGYGDSGGSAVAACSPPAGYAANSDDCDDEDAAIHPGAEEIADGIDNDCDGADLCASPASLSRFPTPEDVDDLDALCESYPNGVTVSLTLTGLDGLTDLSGLSCVCGTSSLSIYDNPDLTDISGFSSLTSATRVTIHDNPNLTDISGFDALETATSISLYTNALTEITGFAALEYAEELGIQDEVALADFSGFAALTEAGGIYLVGNDSLAGLSGLSGLTTLGSLYIDGGALTDLTDLVSLSALDSLQITGGTGWVDLSGLEWVTVIDELGLWSMGLTDLSGLEGLEQVTDWFGIGWMDSMTSLEGLDSLEQVEVLNIYVNTSLTDLTGLESLTTVNDLALSDNTITSLAGLEGLTTISDDLYIYNEDSLESLDGLENLTTIGGDLRLYMNSSLTDISAVHGAAIDGSVLITCNSALSGTAIANFETATGTVVDTDCD